MSGRTGRTLSIQQPWAWLIVNGFKDVENRDWPTRIRGWVGVHAGKTFDAEGYEWVRREFPNVAFAMPQEGASGFPRGGIVGRVRIVDCVEDMDSPWFAGRYGFVLRDAEPLPLIPCRGMLGFFRPQVTA